MKKLGFSFVIITFLFICIASLSHAQVVFDPYLGPMYYDGYTGTFFPMPYVPPPSRSASLLLGTPTVSTPGISTTSLLLSSLYSTAPTTSLYTTPTYLPSTSTSSLLLSSLLGTSTYLPTTTSSLLPSTLGLPTLTTSVVTPTLTPTVPTATSLLLAGGVSSSNLITLSLLGLI